jgi:hypothetical protein
MKRSFEGDVVYLKAYSSLHEQHSGPNWKRIRRMGELTGEQIVTLNKFGTGI